MTSPSPRPDHVRLPGLTEAEGQFYCHGFRTVLRRFTRMTAIGWSMTAIGGAGLLFFWKSPMPHGAADLLLAACVVVAGLAVVQTNVVALQAYVTVPFPRSPEAPASEEAMLLRGWMEEVADGGWREAFGVLQRLERFMKDHTTEETHA